MRGFAICIVCALLAQRADPPRGSVLTEPIVLASDASEQWRVAARVEERLEGTSGRARLAVRLTAIEAYRRVRAGHAGDDGLRFAAALAAGRHLTTLGFHREARSEFAAAYRLATSERERLAAVRERADANRRIGNWAGAREDYVWCADRTRGVDRVVALLRLGEMLRELGEPERAREAWRRAIELEDDCPELIDVYDRLARAALLRGDDAAAAGWLEACRTGLHALLAARTPRGERARRALLSMRARLELHCRAYERVAFDDAVEVAGHE